MSDPIQKKEQIKAFFTEHAAAYSSSESHRNGKDLDKLIEYLGLHATDRVLDLATAAGHTAHALAPYVREVVGVDLTPAMRTEFEVNAAEKALNNVRFEVADAEDLAFPDEYFDVITCRRAAHHFPNILKALQEIARVLKPEGKFGLVDMTSPEDPEVNRFLNTLETIRDPSHVKAYTPEIWLQMLSMVGLEALTQEVLPDVMPWNQWLYPVSAAGPEAQQLEEVLGQTNPYISEAILSTQDSSRQFTKYRLILVARKPSRIEEMEPHQTYSVDKSIPQREQD